MADPQRETNELNEVNKAVDKQQPVDVTVVQKDVRSNPGNMDENAVNADGTEMVHNKIHDGNVTPKPGIRKNKLVAKYGTNFRYMGIVKNGLDRVMVMTSIPIQRFENIEVKPINFARCAKTLEKMIRMTGTLSRQILRHLKQRKNGVHGLFLTWSTYSNKRIITLTKFMNTCVKIYTQLCLN